MCGYGVEGVSGGAVGRVSRVPRGGGSRVGSRGVGGGREACLGALGGGFRPPKMGVP